MLYRQNKLKKAYQNYLKVIAERTMPTLKNPITP